MAELHLFAVLVAMTHAFFRSYVFKDPTKSAVGTFFRTVIKDMIIYVIVLVAVGCVALIFGLSLLETSFPFLRILRHVF